MVYAWSPETVRVISADADCHNNIPVDYHR